MKLSGKSAVAALTAAFTAGTVFGWFLKTWRLQWLAAKRDFFARKAVKAHEQLRVSSNDDPNLI